MEKAACWSVLKQLFRTYHKLHRSMEAQFEVHQLTIAQVEVLGSLYDAPGMTQQELAEHLVVTKGNVTGLIDRLTSRNLVERRVDSGDRRNNCLYLTDNGKNLMHHIAPESTCAAESMLASLSEDEQSTLESLLHRIELEL